VRQNTHTKQDAELTRRERQIMDAIYAAGEASARDVWRRIPDAPTYSTVRTLLAVLEQKGQLARRLVGKAFIYEPIRERRSAAASALRRLLHTFFDGSVERAVSGLLDLEDANLTNEELARIARLIKEARNEKP